MGTCAPHAAATGALPSNVLAHDVRAELLPNAVQRSEATGVVMDEERAVSLEHQEADGLGKPGGESACVKDLAAGDDESHRRRTVLSISDGIR
jgi:hypothetical protein